MNLRFTNLRLTKVPISEPGHKHLEPQPNPDSKLENEPNPKPKLQPESNPDPELKLNPQLNPQPEPKVLPVPIAENKNEMKTVLIVMNIGTGYRIQKTIFPTLNV